MSEMNPIILLQLLMQYHNYLEGRTPRIFKFAKNNRMKVHIETEEETARRKSFVNAETRSAAEDILRKNISETLHGRLGKVWIDPAAIKIAVPLQNSVSESGFGVLPTGSRVKIPAGKKIRAFTYWEKVNDIDLSCFGMDDNGRTKEFSWRNMWYQNGDAVTFSGDETAGYNGGSEYFDIDLDKYRMKYPQYRYLVFCDNVFTDGGRIHFNACLAKGGFMMRDISDSGEIFEPKTVETSFRLTADSGFCYMFAIDIKEREMVWLNIPREGNHAVAGEDRTMRMLLDYMKVTDVYNLVNLFTDLATDFADSPEDADVVVTASGTNIRTGKAEVINAWDTEKVMSLIQPKAG